MNIIVMVVSVISLWSLMTFDGKGKKLKIIYGFIAYLLVVFFGVQFISLFVLNNEVCAIQLVITILMSLPIIRHNGNVSGVISEIRELYEKITIRIRKKHW